MRKIEFDELNLKDKYDEENFYQFYLKSLKKQILPNENFELPVKQYEILFLNIFGGKIILCMTFFVFSYKLNALLSSCP